MAESTNIVRVTDVYKTFQLGKVGVQALKGVNLEIARGNYISIMGPSGSGKTTLLSLLGCVMYPTEGCVCINGVNTRELNDREMAELRLKTIGFVFQNFL